MDPNSFKKSKDSDCEETACFNPDPLSTFKKSRNEFDIFDMSDCPMNRSELGNNSWKLFHTMAAYYPSSPNDEQKKKMSNFFESLQEFYPCSVCAKDLKNQMEKSILSSIN